MKFEEAMKQLDQTVLKLENGDLPLEEALTLFQQGVDLSNQLNKMLDQAEQKIQILTKDSDGALQPKPFEGVGEEA